MTTFTVDPKDYPTPLELAEAGYKGYAERTGGQTFDGRDMPEWKDLPDHTVQAWVAAVVAIQADHTVGVVAQMEEGEMSEVTQTILLNDPSGRPGNCLQAAVASLLDLDLDAVPHFAESTGDWFEDMAVFALGHGYELMQHGPGHLPPTFGLAFGFTNRSAERHAVVYRDGVMVWDPHPSRDGLTTVRTYVDFDPIASARAEVA